jgi:hypothetical protein
MVKGTFVMLKSFNWAVVGSGAGSASLVWTSTRFGGSSLSMSMTADFC